MAYSTQTWADDAIGGTPLTAARLTHMESGIQAAAAVADAPPASTVTVTTSGLSIITHTNAQQGLADLDGLLSLVYQRSEPPTDQGLCGVSIPVASASGTGSPTSGTLQYARIKCTDARTLSKIWISVSVVGSTLTSGQNLLGVCNSSGTLLGKTADQTTTWGATTGVISATLTVQGGQSLAVTAGQVIYAVILSVGTTPPTFFRAGGVSGMTNAGIASAPFRFNTGATSQTALPTTTTMSGLTASTAPWAVAVS